MSSVKKASWSFLAEWTLRTYWHKGLPFPNGKLTPGEITLLLSSKARISTQVALAPGAGSFRTSCPLLGPRLKCKALKLRTGFDECRKQLDPANSCASGWKETCVLVKQGISISERMPTRFFLPNQTEERTWRSPKFISRHQPPEEEHWVPVSLSGRTFLEDDSYSTSYLAPSTQLVQALLLNEWGVEIIALYPGIGPFQRSNTHVSNFLCLLILLKIKNSKAGWVNSPATRCSFLFGPLSCVAGNGWWERSWSSSVKTRECWLCWKVFGECLGSGGGICRAIHAHRYSNQRKCTQNRCVGHIYRMSHFHHVYVLQPTVNLSNTCVPQMIGKPVRW